MCPLLDEKVEHPSERSTETRGPATPLPYVPGAVGAAGGPAALRRLPNRQLFGVRLDHIQLSHGFRPFDP